MSTDRTPHVPPPLAGEEIAAFRATVHAASRANPRDLPWRGTADPYLIMVSEVMLQQTQVDRVAVKFVDFIRRFPHVASLAAAGLAEVLSAWQGLGYNRRALALKRAAEEIVAQFGGAVPGTRQELQTLPGIGPYTAGAILAFAHDLPELFIETNIRSVFIHHFFPGRDRVHDRELLPLVAATLDRERPREWYNALMDYGVVLKREHPNPSRRSSHHVRQTPFAGSNRQLRSALLREVLAHPGLTADALAARVGKEREPVVANLERMAREGLVVSRGGGYVVP